MQVVAETFRQLERTSSRTAMIRTLGQLLKQAPKEYVDKLIYLCQGQLGPPYERVVFGMGEKLIARTLAEAAGVDEAKIASAYKTLGDLGLAAERFLTGPGQGITFPETYDALMQVAQAGGTGAVARKMELLTGLLGQLSGLEACYVLRIIQGRLRLGVGDVTILDAVSFAAVGSSSLRPILEGAYNLCADLGFVAKILFMQGVRELEILAPQVGKPVRPALAERMSSVEQIVDELELVGAEPKYDGIRLQVHKADGLVKIFSRRLEDLTDMFPEIIRGAKEQITARQVIVEGEAVGFNPETGEFLPFQVTMQRRRKYDIEEMSTRYPLRLFLFDLLYVDGENYIPRSLAERRARLESVLRSGPDEPLAMTEQLQTAETKELETFFEDMTQRGLEGIVAKRLNAAYHAGSRNFNWVKLKRGYQAKLADTVDVVLVGYLAGRGKRARFGIGALLAAVYDQAEDRFKTVAKVGSGLSEERWSEIKRLLDAVRTDHRPARVDSILVPDVWAEPAYVVEVQADEITRSPIHTSGRQDDQPGYALRFPRIVGWIREDKSPEDATTVAEILRMYELQSRVLKH